MTEKLSALIKELMGRCVKQPIIKNELQLVGSHHYEILYDEAECDKLLHNFCINRDNVLQYLRKKYIGQPIVKGQINGVLFAASQCIQSAKVNNGIITMKLKNSEPHKILTDVIYVRELLTKYDQPLAYQMIIEIDVVKMNEHDLPLYCLLLERWQQPYPEALDDHCDMLLAKYRDPSRIKKRSIRRKYLRYYLSIGELSWEEFRRMMKP